jgi:malonate transporter MadL subunit
MYIPVVVAMAAQQNVVTALKGGPIAVIAAVVSVVVCGCTIAVISRINKGEPLPKEDELANPLPVIPPTVSPAGGR